MSVEQETSAAPDLSSIRAKRIQIEAAAQRYGASNIRVYGSVARGEAHPESDVDILVEMEEGRSLLDLAGLHIELEEILGFPVEIGTDVKPRLRDRVHSEAVPL